MSDAINLRYLTYAVRIMQHDGETVWHLTDVCQILGLSNPSKVAERLDADQQVILTLTSSESRTTRALFVTESGLYEVIWSSRKPEAKPFKRWCAERIVELRRDAFSIDPAYANHPAVLAAGSAFEAVKLAVQAEKAAQAALNRVDRLERSLGDLDDSYVSVMGWFKLTEGTVNLADAAIIGKYASKLCDERGIDRGKVKDPRFGRVNTYPESIVAEAYQWFSSPRGLLER